MPPCHATCSLHQMLPLDAGTSGRGGAGRGFVSGFTARLRPSGFSPLRLSAPRSVSFVARVRIGAARDQQLDRIQATGRGGEDQRASGGDRFPRVDRSRRRRGASRSPLMSPAAAASISGVAPVLVLASTVAPAADERLDDRRRSPLGREVQRRVGAELRPRARRSRPRRPAPSPDRRRHAARPSAARVTPSPCGALTSAPCLIIASTSARSPRIAASAIDRRRPARPIDRRSPRRRTAASTSAAGSRRSVASLSVRLHPADRRADGLRSDRSSPVLSPNDVSSFMPSMCAIVRKTFAIGVPSGAFDVEPALQLATGLAGQEQRTALVVVHVRVAHRRAVHDQRVVEQRCRRRPASASAARGSTAPG